ncbi:hypothetical protein MRX96_010950 [Rhipicephalus microplus]
MPKPLLDEDSLLGPLALSATLALAAAARSQNGRHYAIAAIFNVAGLLPEAKKDFPKYSPHIPRVSLLTTQPNQDA